MKPKLFGNEKTSAKLGKKGLGRYAPPSLALLLSWFFRPAHTSGRKPDILQEAGHPPIRYGGVHKETA